MGNCMNLLASQEKKAKVFIFNGREKEFRDSTLVEEVPCGPYNGYELVHYSLPHSLLPGEAGCPPPHLMQPHHCSISPKIIKKESCQGPSMKILVTRQQLEFLLSDAKIFWPMKIAIRSSRTFKRGNRKWRPSLSAIPEVTRMVLKVDLQCNRCYKKVKKVLCKFPQIRDQMYDKEADTVTITVVCCSPEKISDKICSKGGESIKSIEIKTTPKPKETEKKPENPKEPQKKLEKPKEPEKKVEKPKEPEKKDEKIKEPEKKSEPKGTLQKLEAPAPPPPIAYPPIGFYSTEYYHGHGGVLTTSVHQPHPQAHVMVGQFMIAGEAAAATSTIMQAKKTHKVAQSCNVEYASC